MIQILSQYACIHFVTALHVNTQFYIIILFTSNWYYSTHGRGLVTKWFVTTYKGLSKYTVLDYTGVKITVGHRPISGQISNVATHFLVCLTHFRSNKSK